jgi:hypothetical protein
MTERWRPHRSSGSAPGSRPAVISLLTAQIDGSASVLPDLSPSLSVVLSIDVAEADLGRFSVSDLLEVTVGRGPGAGVSRRLLRCRLMISSCPLGEVGVAGLPAPVTGSCRTAASWPSGPAAGVSSGWEAASARRRSAWRGLGRSASWCGSLLLGAAGAPGRALAWASCGTVPSAPRSCGRPVKIVSVSHRLWRFKFWLAWVSTGSYSVEAVSPYKRGAAGSNPAAPTVFRSLR